MAQAESQAVASFWTERLYAALSLPPLAVGALLATTLYGVFLAVETAIGRPPFGPGLEESGEALITLLLCVLLGYLCTATISAIREGPRAVRRVRPLLAGSEPELDALERAAASRPRGLLLWAGVTGAVVAFLAPLVEAGGSEELHALDPRGWNNASVWHRLLSPCVGWWVGRLLAVMGIDSRRHSELAERIARIDLLDPGALVPFARLGLSNALRVIGAAAIFSFFLLDVQRYAVLVLIVAGIVVVAATAALLLPVRGVHLRIRAAKQAELDAVHQAIHGESSALARSALARRSDPPSLADLVAYRELVAAAREWPFDSSTVVRFALYLLIPLGSWLGGAVAERLISALLD